MIGLLKKLKELFYKKYRVLKDVLGNTLVYFVYYNVPIDQNLVYVESQNGDALNGNLLRICEELNKKEYSNLKIVIKATQNSKKNIEMLLKKYKLFNAKIVIKTIFALMYMERAKYIFYDAGMQSRFVKRKGQIFVNTWHGTPFKVMGKRSLAERHSIGNLQRNFFMCDYLLFPNEYMMNIFVRDYMLENLWNGTALLTGYPRNSVLFDMKHSVTVKEKLGFKGKQVFAYLPTYRGTFFDKKNEQQAKEVLDYLQEIDDKLNDNQVLLLKFHLYNKQKVDCSKYKHIINFPDGWETYEVLNIVDCLITDYSSVFFDFANTRKKIILFAYDEEEYFEDRGVYFPFSSLPFPKVRNVEDLVKELNSEKEYDDSKFLDKYCLYDSINATSELCKHIIKGEKCCKEKFAKHNGKENVLIYAGNLAKNGITTSLINCLNMIDTDKRNYYVTFYRGSVGTSEKTMCIPDKIPFLPLATAPFFTLFEKIAHRKLLKSNKKINTLSKYLKRLYRREIVKQFWDVHFDHVIQFDGYTKNAMLLFNEFSCKKTIFVHSDMMSEIYVKGNQSYTLLNFIYNSYENVAVVSTDIIDSTLQITDNKKELKISNNFFDYQGVLSRSNHNIEFQKDTEMVTFNPSGLRGALESKGTKFINIGRFSPEKGHLRLLRAFEKYYMNNKDAQLIIIGGYGVEYNKTVKYLKTLACWRNVTIIKSINNPMPILKRCDCFVLASLYEGLGMVLMEADALEKPCFSTDIVGPRLFMQKHNGYLVDDSEEGLLKGMYAFDEGRIGCLKVDYNKYNEQCLKEFEALF